MKPVPDYTQMAVLHDQGWAAPAIAAELECHERTVTRWRTRTGRAQQSPPFANKPLTLERRAAIERMLDDGASFNDITNTLHVHRRTLTRHFPGRGWSATQSGKASVLSRRLNNLQPLNR